MRQSVYVCVREIMPTTHERTRVFMDGHNSGTLCDLCVDGELL